MIDPTTEWANTDLGDCEDITTAGDITQLTTKQKFTNLDLSPFWVGQSLVATGTGGGGSAGLPAPGKKAVVSAIEWDKDNGGVLNITFTESLLTLGGAETLTAIKLVPYATTTASMDINFAELVVKRVGNPVGIDQINYDTFSTEETNGLGLKSFQNQYQIEADAKDVVIGFPNEDSDLISCNNDIESFRLRLNNQDLTDRLVEVDSPLYYDRVSMTLGNMGESMKNLTQNYGDQDATDWADVYAKTDFDVVSVMNPLFITEREKYLQLNINATGNGVNKITLFKHLPRSIEL